MQKQLCDAPDQQIADREIPLRRQRTQYEARWNLRDSRVIGDPSANDQQTAARSTHWQTNTALGIRLVLDRTGNDGR